MKNNLERYIRDNREAFDAPEPPMDLWERIEPGLIQPTVTDATALPPSADQLSPRLNGSRTAAGPRQNGNLLNGGWPALRTSWWVAASIALLLAGGLCLNQKYGLAEQPEVVAVNPGYAKEFVQYTRLVDQKQAELKAMTASNPALYQAFATDLDRLERSYQTLKADLPANPNQETLVQAMIQNLQLQLDLLNEQLRVIQRMKAQNNNTHELLI